MLSLFIAIMVVWGITLIIVQGTIFDPIKEKMQIAIARDKYDSLTWFLKKILKLVNCFMCMGFHVGWFVGIFLGPFPGWNILFNGAFYSGVTWIIYSFVQYLGNGYDPARTINIIKDEEVNDEETLIEKEKSI